MSTRRLYVILFVLLFTVTVISYLLLRDVLSGLQVAEEFLFLSARRRAYIITTLFRQNTYLQNKKHTLTCQVGLVVTDLITSPVVSWEGWETPPPPPSTEAQLSFFAQPPAW